MAIFLLGLCCALLLVGAPSWTLVLVWLFGLSHFSGKVIEARYSKPPSLHESGDR